MSGSILCARTFGLREWAPFGFPNRGRGGVPSIAPSVSAGAGQVEALHFFSKCDEPTKKSFLASCYCCSWGVMEKGKKIIICALSDSCNVIFLIQYLTSI